MAEPADGAESPQAGEGVQVVAGEWKQGLLEDELGDGGDRDANCGGGQPAEHGSADGGGGGQRRPEHRWHQQVQQVGEEAGGLAVGHTAEQDD